MARPRSNHLRDEELEHDPRDTRTGDWTRLELIKMDDRFCRPLERAHPDLAEPHEPARKRA